MVRGESLSASRQCRLELIFSFSVCWELPDFFLGCLPEHCHGGWISNSESFAGTREPTEMASHTTWNNQQWEYSDRGAQANFGHGVHIFCGCLCRKQKRCACVCELGVALFSISATMLCWSAFAPTPPGLAQHLLRTMLYKRRSLRNASTWHSPSMCWLFGDVLIFGFARVHTERFDFVWHVLT